MDDERRQQELIEAILADRSPVFPGGLTDEEVSLAQTAALLRAGREGALQPDPAFVDDLHSRLFGSAAAARREPTTEESATAAPAPGQRTRPLSRRRLLGALAGGATAGLGMGIAGGHAAAEGEATARVRALERQMADQRAAAARKEGRPYTVPLVGTQGQWSTVAMDDQVPPGGTLRFETGALVGYLLRDHAGGYRAVSAACTHMGCLLTWQDSGRRLLCPCHGAAYDEQGAVVSGVARHPLPAIAVRVEGREVQVWTVPSGAQGSGVPRYSEP